MHRAQAVEQPVGILDVAITFSDEKLDDGRERALRQPRLNGSKCAFVT